MSHPNSVPGKVDALQALVAESMADLLERTGVIIPLEVLIRLELVSVEDVEDWRNGGLPYLERSITSGLSRVARVLRLIQERALALGLVPSQGKYLRRGKGRRQRLRFSKRGDAESERLYSSHFLRPQTPRAALPPDAPPAALDGDPAPASDDE